ncbi:uncharacterized protein [Physcomitrium patens]|uniref:Protein PAM68, chloroplastic n=1 Tax=Physcomitrium patens TaxID=3218 RepID=A0A2K1ISM3_PHYPA|nr:protein PAM68, chloroplastic-like [Physcomitrium patens]PNR32279.1 hypothetical protein PHYPA_026405 [Physcomitrium patens]|eukprot:XP_024359957.1 protein PAM68, chloroplastic-like [Physcomitrella patens]
MISTMLPSTAVCGSSHSSLYALLPLCARSSSPSLYPVPNLGRRSYGASRGERLLTLAVQKSPKGFGKAPEKEKKVQKKEGKLDGSLRSGTQADPQDERQEPEDDVVPEVVTNRMLKRIAFTVGIPFAIGVAFFVLYYYLKAVKKVDIPEWLPLFTSFLTFGSAGAGITYGVLSASWDPKREGSLLGWKEAQLNWPVFWDTFRGKRDDLKRW